MAYITKMQNTSKWRPSSESRRTALSLLWMKPSIFPECAAATGSPSLKFGADYPWCSTCCLVFSVLCVVRSVCRLLHVVRVVHVVCVVCCPPHVLTTGGPVPASTCGRSPRSLPSSTCSNTIPEMSGHAVCPRPCAGGPPHYPHP